MKGSNEPRVPARASVPIAVQTCARSARCTASLRANEATEAENAVPLRMPRCSLDASGIGAMLCLLSAVTEEYISRAPNKLGPSKTRMAGFPLNAPAI
jgi:hypothetical protein